MSQIEGCPQQGCVHNVERKCIAEKVTLEPIDPLSLSSKGLICKTFRFMSEAERLNKGVLKW